MKKLVILFLLVPFMGMSQNSKVFIKLTNADGKQIPGSVTVKGYERWIEAYTTSSAGPNNTQFLFSMPVTDASVLLKKMMSVGERVSYADVVIATVGVNGNLIVTQTIKMEQASVTSCSESMGCNSAMTTSVALQATRIGWTSYSIDRSGTLSTVSQKFGWDASTNSPWTKF